MKTIRTMAVLSFFFVLTSCASWEASKQRKQERESYANPFYLKYLDEGNKLDREILARIEVLRADPSSPPVHNELGALLFERRFPKDSRYEFERALRLDKRFYSARYNLAILEISEGNTARARRLLKEVVDQKPGHAEAHFTLGLLYEKSGRTSAAIDHYAQAYTIDPDMLKYKRNPRLVESELVTATLLVLYPEQSARKSTQFLPAPDGYVAPKPKQDKNEPAPPPAAAPQAPVPPPQPPAPGR